MLGLKLIHVNKRSLLNPPEIHRKPKSRKFHGLIIRFSNHFCENGDSLTTVLCVKFGNDGGITFNLIWVLVRFLICYMLLLLILPDILDTTRIINPLLRSRKRYVICDILPSTQSAIRPTFLHSIRLKRSNPHAAVLSCRSCCLM